MRTADEIREHGREIFDSVTKFKEDVAAAIAANADQQLVMTMSVLAEVTLLHSDLNALAAEICERLDRDFENRTRIRGEL
jgi:hypothetical protein